MEKELLIGSIGLALFIICPRMAGMVNIIAKHSDVSLVLITLLGGIISIPLMIVIVLVFSKFGLWGALLFCVFTDIGAAFIMKELSVKAGIETFVIALFVILGVKVAPFIASFFVKS